MDKNDQRTETKAEFNKHVSLALRAVESDSLMYAKMHLDNAATALENLKALKENP